ncbi:MAG: LysR family transcriptional regulator [Thiotrichales bacterium]|nr:LysR family transcriptional regulator [Thiotrichales bacterium]
MAKTTFEFFQLRCFVTIAEELNFRRAAQRLNMTQPPLSRQIKLLEESIGLRLLDRDNRSVRLTPAGTVFRASAVELLERAEVAVLIARQAERGEAGAITLGFVPSAALDFVPRIVSSLKRDLPAVQFAPVEMMSYEIAEALMSGGLDLGLTRTVGATRDIESTRVVREPFVLALPLGHRLDRPGTADASDLDGEDFVGYSAERGGYLREIHAGLFAAVGIRPNILQEVSQTHTVLSLVNTGLGVALVPRSAMAMRMDQLVYREIDLPDQFTSTIYLNMVRNRDSALLGNVRVKVIQALSEVSS